MFRGCLPSLELWRWRRAIGWPYRTGRLWTPEHLKDERERMLEQKAEWRRELEERATGPLQLRGTARRLDGSREVMIRRRIRRKFPSKAEEEARGNGGDRDGASAA